MSARTGGLILAAAAVRPHARRRRAPTACSTRRPATPGSTPWVAHLRGARRGAARCGAPVEGIAVRDGRRRRRDGRGARRVTADFYVAALPVEVHARRCSRRSCARAEPRLNGLDRLVTRWMNGILFYLDDDVPLVRRPRDLHRLRVGADVDLAAPVLARRRLRQVGDGRVGGILSIDISDWHAPGGATGKVGRAVHAARRSATRSGRSCATTSTTRSTAWSVVLAGSWTRRSSSRTRRARPTPSRCWSTPPGSWADRPDAATAIPNLLLAADYVRTLHRPGDDGGRQRGGPPRGQRDPRRDAARARRAASVWPLREPPALGPARVLDKVLWRLRRPAPSPIRVSRRGRCQRPVWSGASWPRFRQDERRERVRRRLGMFRAGIVGAQSARPGGEPARAEADRAADRQRLAGAARHAYGSRQPRVPGLARERRHARQARPTAHPARL